ncbi:hypothetical protein GC105_14135 [Alkalibaculum sp. M08DMB]|uniref:Uncharacterized protein n=1 Tax=Alkalibaculum sporogenes TaxID=2655001 RepID=A0A6A7KC97_9FIRM|nr:hypothetical protein [Alkalibaculum sporogenes]MPW26921.1 hypothetical protein [Alkalibaculum sporogenes]
MVDITNLLGSTSVNTILNTIESMPELVWINRDMFKDIIKAADYRGELNQNEIDMYIRMLSDDDFISIIEPVFNNCEYLLLDQTTYGLLNENFVKGKKKEYLFIKEKILNKLLIQTYVKYEWILKAMAIDYSKYVDMDLMETYKEYFNENNRIIESTLLDGFYNEGNNKWEIDIEHNTLIYSFGKKRVLWTQGEAEYRFDELINN